MTPYILPVIHYESDTQALLNAEIAFDNGCEGVFVIHMDGRNHLLPKIADDIKTKWPDKMVGINFLGHDPAKALASNIANGLDMTWTDTQLTHSAYEPWPDAKKVKRALLKSPGHLFFSAVAFKYQEEEPHPDKAAQIACKMGFVPTTSGSATGVAADVDKIISLRKAIGDGPLAIASGITPDNVSQFAPHLSHILIATGVSHDFHNLDKKKLRALMDNIQNL